MREVFLAALLLLAGCATKSTYLEGTCVQLGAYIPMDGSLLGLEVVNYLSGCSVRAATNQSFKIDREYVSMSSYFGIVNIQEATKTSVEVNGK